MRKPSAASASKPDKLTGGDNRLSPFVGNAFGLDPDEALKQADSRLAALRGPATATLDDFVLAIGFYLNVPINPPPACVRQELQRLAHEIEALAGTFEMEPLGEAAASFSDLIDLYEEKDIWVREPAEVHFDAMRLLASSRSGPLARTTTLDGVRRVMDHMRTVHGAD